MLFRYRERILENLKLRTHSVKVNRNNIEASDRPARNLPQILSRDFAQIMLLFEVHCYLGRDEFLRRPRLHFNEAGLVFAPADQIDLTGSAWRAVITRHHHIPELPQMEVRGLFAALADVKMCGPL